jgi:hypothetical protein
MILNNELFNLPISEVKLYGKENLVYGTLTMKGIETMVSTIKKYIQGTIYGFDIGCGDGELLYHLQTKLNDSVWEGVEISETRISMQTRNVNIWQGNMLYENFRPYNILHADNLCLHESIADELEEKIANEFSGLYITYRPPENIRLLQKSVYLDSVITEASWGKHTIQYFQVN